MLCDEAIFINVNEARCMAELVERTLFLNFVL